MAKKAELEQSHEDYERIHRDLACALNVRDFHLAMKLAESAIPLQFASHNYRRRFLKATDSHTPAVDTILKYAPAFFLSKSIDAVDSWFGSGSRTERTAFGDMPERIAAARNLVSHSVNLWRAFSVSPTAAISLPSDSRNDAILPIWVSASLVAIKADSPGTYFRVTDPRRDVVAKCSSCGRERRALMQEILEPTRCPACERRSVFIIVRRAFST